MDECGTIKAHYKEKDVDCAKLLSGNGIVYLFIESGLKSSFCYHIVEKLWAELAPSQIVGLGTVYKTSYTGINGHFEIDEDKPLPIRYVKNNHAKAFDAFLSAHPEIEVANQFSMTGGLTAQFMMEAEMRGTPAIGLKVITNEHRVTSEGLQGFEPIVKDLLGMKDAKMDEIYRYPQFKPVLKELNAISNGIYM